MLNFEKIKLYRYYFEGLDEPLIITAYNRKQARNSLSLALYNIGIDFKLLGETVTLPVIGFTKIKKNGIEYLWVGLENSPNGWCLL